MARLPSDLRFLIYGYLPLKKLQLLEEQFAVAGFNLLPTQAKAGLSMLLQTKYRIPATEIADHLTSDMPLIPFESYCHLAMLAGDIGYNGQWYLPPYAALFAAIRHGDMELFDYYVDRYLEARFHFHSRVDDVLQALKWPLHSSYGLVLLTRLLFSSVDQIDSRLVADHMRSRLRRILFAIPDENLANVVRPEIKVPRLGPLSIYELTSALIFMDYDDVPMGRHHPFPRINLKQIRYHLINFYFFIPKSYIDAAVNMIRVIETNFPPSAERNEYLLTLHVLAGHDINLADFDTSSSDDVIALLTLVTSVMNGNAWRSIVRREPVSAPARRLVIGPLISEVIYDAEMAIQGSAAIQTNLMPPASFSLDLFPDTLLISAYLAGRTIESGVYPGPLQTLYYDYQNQTGNRTIYDAETAARLSDYFNVRRHLRPVTPFDEKLMRLFGFEILS